MDAKPSLELLLKDIDLQRQTQRCTSDHLSKIALHITQWQTIAPHLRLEDVDEEDIVTKYPNNVKAQKLAMLKKWKKINGDKATYKELAAVFWELDRLDLVAKVCEVLRCESSSSGSEWESVQKYADYLKGTYCTPRPPVLNLPWPPPPTTTVFNLALIQKRKFEFGPNEELIRLLQRGQVKEAAESHTEIELSNLMKADDEKRKIILIEGAPGSGKSTLAWHICQQWGKGELFTEYEVVVFIQLRDLELQTATSLAEILPVECTDMAPDIAALLTRSGIWGKEVLLVLDGWDELQPDCPLHTLLMRLIAHPTHSNMHFSSVIVTSRPVSSGELQYYASSRVEVLGFKPKEVQEYFKDCFGSDYQEYTKFVAQLNERQVIEASCFLPLNAVIVVHTYLACNCSLPHTLHGVFERLVLLCIVRHVTDREEAKDIKKTSCLSDLPRDIQAPLLALSSLAFYGIRLNKVVFSETNLSDAELAVDVRSTLSLVQEVESFRMYGRSKSYNFFHLQIQELLAAYHISQLEEDEQVRCFEHLFGTPRFAAVFQFYAAFTKLQANGIRDILLDMMNNGTSSDTVHVLQCVYEAQDPHLCQFIGAAIQEMRLPFLSSKSNPLYIIALGYFLCYYCYYCTDVLSISVYDVDVNIIRLLVREFLWHKSHFTAASSQDGHLTVRVLLSAANCVETLQCTSELLCQLQPFICGLMFDIQDSVLFETFPKVASTLCMLIQRASSLQHFELTNFSPSRVVSVNLFEFVKSIHSNKQIQSLKIKGLVLQISKESLKAICTVMTTKSAVKHLTLHNCDFDPKDLAGPLLHAMQISNTLKVIDLMNTSLGGYVSSLLTSLTSNTSIVELILDECCLDLTGKNGQALYYMLKTNRALKTLNLRRSKRRELNTQAVDLKAVCDGLTQNTSLVYLDLSGCGLTDTAKSGRAIAHMLQTNSTLKSLKLDDNGEINKVAIYLAQGLAQNKGLETLSIVRCRISAAVMKLAEALKTNKYLLSLDISWSDIREGFVHLVSGLKVNSTLQNLKAISCGIKHTGILAKSSLESFDLSHNPIGDEGAELIAELVTKSRSLYQLNLQCCGIGNKGVTCLASALKVNTSLEILDMSQNRFTDTGLLTLGRSLKRNKTLRKLHVHKFLDRFAAVDAKQFVSGLCENLYLTDLCLLGDDYLREEVRKVNQIRRCKNCKILRLKPITEKESPQSQHPFLQSQFVPSPF